QRSALPAVSMNVTASRSMRMELASRVAASLRQQALTSSTHRPATRPASLTVAPRARVAMQIRSIEPSGAQDSYHANPPLADLRLQRAELGPGADAEVKCRYIGPAGISPRPHLALWGSLTGDGGLAAPRALFPTLAVAFAARVA